MQPSCSFEPKMDAEAVKMIRFRAQTEQTLVNTVLMTDMALELKNRADIGDKYVKSLRCTVARSRKDVLAMKASAQGFIQLALLLSESSVRHLEKSITADHNINKLRQQYTRVIHVLRKQCTQENAEVSTNIANKCSSISIATEKIRTLEAKQLQQKRSGGINSQLLKTNRVDANEKYPKNFTKELLVDLSAAVNLPTVPEDVFTTFAHPMKSASLCSVKSLKKLMRTLQKAEAANQEIIILEPECKELNQQVYNLLKYGG